MIIDIKDHRLTTLQGEAETDPNQEVVDFMGLTKEAMINKFIIPNYPLKRVLNQGSLDLFFPTLSAFYKGIRATFGCGETPTDISKLIGEANLTAIEDRFVELTTTDFVSIFEYIMEGQDRVLESIKIAKARKEVRRLLEETADKLCLSPLELGSLISKIDSVGIFPNQMVEGSSLLKYDYEIGDFWGYLKPTGFLLDLRSILQGLDLDWTNVEIADFLQAFGLQFDGDSEACFYEAWCAYEIDGINGGWEVDEEQRESLYWLKDSRGHLLDSVKKWNQDGVLFEDNGDSITSDSLGGFYEIFAKQNVVFNQ
mgnify:CR=1 FL=1